MTLCAVISCNHDYVRQWMASDFIPPYNMPYILIDGSGLIILTYKFHINLYSTYILHCPEFRFCTTESVAYIMHTCKFENGHQKKNLYFFE